MKESLYPRTVSAFERFVTAEELEREIDDLCLSKAFQVIKCGVKAYSLLKEAFKERISFDSYDNLLDNRYYRLHPQYFEMNETIGTLIGAVLVRDKMVDEDIVRLHRLSKTCTEELVYIVNVRSNNE